MITLRWPMVCPVVSIFTHGAAKFGRRHKNGVLHSIPDIFRKRGESRTELLQQTRQLWRFIGVMIPATDVRKGSLNADIGFDQSSATKGKTRYRHACYGFRRTGLSPVGFFRKVSSAHVDSPSPKLCLAR
jgi:hypothetical protein